MARRVRFLQMACRELGLENVTVQECDIEKATGTLTGAAMTPLWPELSLRSKRFGR